MNKRIQRLGLSALSLLVAACTLTPIDTTTDATGAGDGVLGSTDATADDVATTVGDGAGESCVPACSPWQTCAAGVCGTKTCGADSECRGPEEASDPKHFCYKGKCAAFQCAVDSECPEDQHCNTAAWLCEANATGCIGHADCEDQNACTLDFCDEFGACSNTKKAGCCVANTDCNDGSACTNDTCESGICQFNSLADCCSSDLDCDDAKPCTTDTCVGGSCKYAKIASCCSADIECDDGEDWSSDSCQQTQCVHSVTAVAQSCSSAGECQSNKCALVQCLGGKCSWYKEFPEPVGCCKTDANCAKDVACQVDSCETLQCTSKPATGISGHLWYRFNSIPANQWTFKGSSQSVKFHLTDLVKVGGDGALRYGIPNKVSFEDSTANKGDAVSPAFTVPQSGALSFWVLLDASPGAAIHLAGLDVLDEAGATLQAGLWSKAVDLNTGTTSGKWVQAQKSLAPWAGKKIRLRAWFDQVKYDTSNKDKFGLVIDEMVVSGACP